jgi:hypothetical protein
VTAPAFPIARLLVPPAAPAAVAAGLERFEAIIAGGLPHVIALAEGLSLVLAVPSGLARTWAEEDPSTVVSDSGPELADHDPSAPAPPVGAPVRAPARLFLRSGTDLLAVVPLVAGRRWLLPDGGDPDGVRIELAVLSWRIHAGTLRGTGDFGSRLELAWRPATRAADTFSPPPISARVLARQPSA